MRVLIAFACLAALVGVGVFAVTREGSDAWTPERRADFGLLGISTTRCPHPGATNAQIRYQDAVDAASLNERLFKVIGRRWGGVWFDKCRGYRFAVGLTPAPKEDLEARLRTSREIVRRAGFAGRIDFVAVDHSPFELGAQQEVFLRRLGGLRDALGDIGRDDVHNRIDVEFVLGNTVEQERKARAVAKTLTVPVHFHLFDE